MARALPCAARVEALLMRHWWQPRPTTFARALSPLAWCYRRLAAGDRARTKPSQHSPVPVLVVGNLVVGGAGKTPTVIALVQALQAVGHRPGVISRGYGRNEDGAREVQPTDDPARVGDEPLLIRRRTGAPVWVARNRSAAAQALCESHPQVDVLLSDDGLQHRALARDAELVVFDERGAGNGLLLPAGPLREPLLGHVPPNMRVLYTAGRASTPLPGALAHPAISAAWPLAAWRDGAAGTAVPLAALRGRTLLAVAGMAAPEKFFGMLEAAGLAIRRLPQPDHHDYRTLPWPPGTEDVITTEKDAVKLRLEELGGTRVWVVPLDLQLPAALVGELLALLFKPNAVPTAP